MAYILTEYLPFFPSCYQQQIIHVHLQYAFVIVNPCSVRVLENNVQEIQNNILTSCMCLCVCVCCPRCHTHGPAQPPSVMLTCTWVGCLRPWPRKSWSSSSPNMGESSPPASSSTRSQVSIAWLYSCTIYMNIPIHVFWEMAEIPFDLTATVSMDINGLLLITVESLVQLHLCMI